MQQLEKQISWCLKKGSERKRHRGLKPINPNADLANAHLKKAEHNFKAMASFQKTGFSDWSVSASFYCLYHCLLGILAKHGYESRNQVCTFAVVEELINKRKVVNLFLEDLKDIADLDVSEQMESSDIISIREDFQYSTKMAL
ncbi:MAG: HEPN domain-containing protein, partial [Deltaproteobacteria bacterium]|nr:HEPN domain-containing protein [Deltaproteobacteria bacterium]